MCHPIIQSPAELQGAVRRGCGNVSWQCSPSTPRAAFPRAAPPVVRDRRFRARRPDAHRKRFLASVFRVRAVCGACEGLPESAATAENIGSMSSVCGPSNLDARIEMRLPARLRWPRRGRRQEGGPVASLRRLEAHSCQSPVASHHTARPMIDLCAEMADAPDLIPPALGTPPPGEHPGTQSPQNDPQTAPPSSFILPPAVGAACQVGPAALR
jgi:hypothetical protein